MSKQTVKAHYLHMTQTIDRMDTIEKLDELMEKSWADKVYSLKEEPIIDLNTPKVSDEQQGSYSNTFLRTLSFEINDMNLFLDFNDKLDLRNQLSFPSNKELTINIEFSGDNPDDKVKSYKEIRGRKIDTLQNIIQSHKQDLSNYIIQKDQDIQKLYKKKKDELEQKTKENKRYK